MFDHLNLHAVVKPRNFLKSFIATLLQNEQVLGIKASSPIPGSACLTFTLLAEVLGKEVEGRRKRTLYFLFSIAYKLPNTA